MPIRNSLPLLQVLDEAILAFSRLRLAKRKTNKVKGYDSGDEKSTPVKLDDVMAMVDLGDDIISTEEKAGGDYVRLKKDFEMEVNAKKGMLQPGSCFSYREKVGHLGSHDYAQGFMAFTDVLAS